MNDLQQAKKLYNIYSNALLNIQHMSVNNVLYYLVEHKLAFGICYAWRKRYNEELLIKFPNRTTKGGLMYGRLQWINAQGKGLKTPFCIEKTFLKNIFKNILNLKS